MFTPLEGAKHSPTNPEMVVSNVEALVILSGIPFADYAGIASALRLDMNLMIQGGFQRLETQEGIWESKGFRLPPFQVTPAETGDAGYVLYFPENDALEEDIARRLNHKRGFYSSNVLVTMAKIDGSMSIDFAMILQELNQLGVPTTVTGEEVANYFKRNSHGAHPYHPEELRDKTRFVLAERNGLTVAIAAEKGVQREHWDKMLRQENWEVDGPILSVIPIDLYSNPSDPSISIKISPRDDIPNFDPKVQAAALDLTQLTVDAFKSMQSAA